MVRKSFFAFLKLPKEQYDLISFDLITFILISISTQHCIKIKRDDRNCISFLAQYIKNFNKKLKKGWHPEDRD